MDFPALVCPSEPSLLVALTGRDLVVRVGDPAQVVEVPSRVATRGNRLVRVVLEHEGPLAGLELLPAWAGTPLWIRVPSAGRFREVAPRLEALRSLGVRVVLPASSAAGRRDLRLLSSVGIPCVASLEGPPPDWEALADLMTWTLLERVAHAPVEPFHLMAHPDEEERATWPRYDHRLPRRYLHLDAAGRVAADAGALARGEFLCESLEGLDGVVELPAYREQVLGWQRRFLDDHACSRCPGFKLCRGVLAPAQGEPVGCGEFLTELLDVAERHRGMQRRAAAREGAPWQP